jgi:hypothetical protein
MERRDYISPKFHGASGSHLWLDAVFLKQGDHPRRLSWLTRSSYCLPLYLPTYVI